METSEQACKLIASPCFESKSAEVVAPSAAIIPSFPATMASAAAAAVTQPANPLNKFSAKVVSVTDGATVFVPAPGNLAYAVRLAGIDAPEHDRAFGAQSTQHLASLICGKTVTLECENERSCSSANEQTAIRTNADREG